MAGGVPFSAAQGRVVRPGPAAGWEDQLLLSGSAQPRLAGLLGLNGIPVVPLASCSRGTGILPMTLHGRDARATAPPRRGGITTVASPPPNAATPDLAVDDVGGYG